jgi:hypothetical protein
LVTFSITLSIWAPISFRYCLVSSLEYLTFSAVAGKADVRFQPEEYKSYFEDWNLAPNAEIGLEGRL